jgi:hypothetical protein
MPVGDTTDDTQAWNWVQTAAASGDTDVEYNELVYIPAANLSSIESAWSQWFEFDYALRRADFHYVDGNGAVSDMDIIAEAE